MLAVTEGDGVAKSAGLAGDLDALLEEFLQGGDVHDFVLHRLRAVDDECGRLLLLGPTSFTHLLQLLQTETAGERE